MASDLAQPDAPPLGRNVSFHLLWTSVLASGFGDRLAMLAALQMLGYASGEVQNAVVAAGVDLFFFLPYLLWAPLAGWLADRLPRRFLLFAADQTRGLFVVGAFFVIPYTAGQVLGDEHHWMVWAFMLGIGFMAATMVPAKLSIVPNVTGLHDLQRANAAVVCMGITGNLLGYLIGGEMLRAAPGESVSVGPMIALAAACYFVSGGFWLFVRTPWKQRAARKMKRAFEVLTEIVDGLRYARKHRPVRTVVLAAALVWAGTSIYLPALHVINVDLYGGDFPSMTKLVGALGIGMLLGSVVMGVANTRFGAELYISVGMFGVGVCIIAQMLIPSYAIGVAIALATGVCASVILVPLNTLIQRVAADQIRGRVFAAKQVVTQIGKVGASLLIFVATFDVDAWIAWVTIAMGVATIAAAVWGFVRFVMRGPLERPSQNLVWRMARLYAHAMHAVVVTGHHRVPRRGPVLIVANHTAGIDPVLIQSVIPRVIRWMMVDSYRSWWLGWLWYVNDPISVYYDERDTRSVRRAIQLLREGEIVGIFPEGGLNRERDTLLEFNPGAGLIARKSGAVVIPVYISGTPVTWSPLTAYLLPSRSRVAFGKPMRVEKGASRESWLAAMEAEIEKLGTVVEAERGSSKNGAPDHADAPFDSA